MCKTILLSSDAYVHASGAREHVLLHFLFDACLPFLENFFKSEWPKTADEDAIKARSKQIEALTSEMLVR